MSSLTPTLHEGSLEQTLDKQLVRAELEARLLGRRQPVLVGRFELLRCVGTGSSGIVYAARDPEHGGEVALKLLRLVDGHTIGSLKHEFRALADITHTNLVALHELVAERGRWFISMELIDGLPFDRWVRAAPGNLEVRLRVGLAQLAEALAVLHQAGKLHRDLKPSNVVVTAMKRLVVLDFGLVSAAPKAATASAPPARIVGTPAYVSPEQAAGELAEQASDWYAVGVMLFEALTGRLPFVGTASEVLQAKQVRPAPGLRSFCPDVSVEIEELCSQLLERDPAARLDARGVQRWLGGASSVAAARTRYSDAPTVGRFFGRQSELSELAAVRADVENGAGKSALIGGAPGMGKTALLDAFATTLGDELLVLRGRCREEESVPYKVFDAVVDALNEVLCTRPDPEVEALIPDNIASLLQLFPVLGQSPAIAAKVFTNPMRPASHRELRSQGFQAFSQLLMRLARIKPIAVLIDDLHWGDIDSASMFDEVLGAHSPPRVLFVGAFRSDEIDSDGFLGRVLAGRDIHQTWGPSIIDLKPLSYADSLELTQDLLRVEGIAIEADVAHKLAAGAAGIPFVVTEFVQHVKSLHPLDAEELLSSEALEPAIAIRKRVAQLPSSARHLLEVLSCAGAPLEVRIALHAGHLPADEHAALVLLRKSRLARSRYTRPFEALETYHDCIRQAVVQGLAPEQVAQTHAALVAALDAHSIDDPDRLYSHCRAAGQTTRAWESALRAAEIAHRGLAFNRAAELVQSAVDLMGDDVARDRDLHRQLGDALALAGRGMLAAEAYSKAARYGRGADARLLRRRAAQQYLRTGYIDRGVALAVDSLREVGVAAPRRGVLRLYGFLWERMRLSLSGFEFKRIARRRQDTSRESLEALEEIFPALIYINPLLFGCLHARYLRVALATHDAARAVNGLVWEIHLAAWTQGPAKIHRIDQLLLATRALTKTVDTPYADAMYELARAQQLLAKHGRYVDAELAASQAETRLRACPGTTWERDVALWTRLMCLEFTGQFATLKTVARERLRDADERGDRSTLFLMLLSIPRAHLVDDEPDAALEFLGRQHERLGSEYNTFRHLWLLRSIDSLSYLGRASEAILLTANWFRALRRSHVFTSPFAREAFYCFFSRGLLNAYAQTGQRQYKRRAERVISKYEDASTAYGITQRAFRHVLLAAEGQVERAISGLDQSIRELEAAQCFAGAVCFRRLRCELAHDIEGVNAVDALLRHQGIANPERWARFICGGHHQGGRSLM